MDRWLWLLAVELVGVAAIAYAVFAMIRSFNRGRFTIYSSYSSSKQVVTRSESPITFWTLMIFGAVAILFTAAVLALALIYLR